MLLATIQSRGCRRSTSIKRSMRASSFHNRLRLYVQGSCYRLLDHEIFQMKFKIKTVTVTVATPFKAAAFFVRSTLAAVCAVALIALLVASAHAQLPKFDTQPGKWSYNTRTEIPGVGNIPVNFDQCITQKDIDEGKNLSSQKDAGIDCKYGNVKVAGNRYQFVATCTGTNLKEPMVMSYDMTATPTQIDSKMTMTGGAANAAGGKMNVSMNAKRIGGC
jgi:hypothetical protein